MAAQAFELRSLAGWDIEPGVQRESDCLRGTVVSTLLTLRRYGLQAEHLLTGARADGYALRDAMADQIILWPSRRQITTQPGVLAIVLDQAAPFQ